jgi:hypothetical protein
MNISSPGYKVPIRGLGEAWIELKDGSEEDKGVLANSDEPSEQLGYSVKAFMKAVGCLTCDPRSQPTTKGGHQEQKYQKFKTIEG